MKETGELECCAGLIESSCVDARRMGTSMGIRINSRWNNGRDFPINFVVKYLRFGFVEGI